MTKDEREAFEEAVEIAVDRLRRGDSVEYVPAFPCQLDYKSVECVVDTAQRELRKQRSQQRHTTVPNSCDVNQQSNRRAATSTS